MTVQALKDFVYVGILMFPGVKKSHFKNSEKQPTLIILKMV